MSNESAAATQPHLIHYSVNDEPQETSEHELTPRQILTNAGINADENYLVEIHGQKRESYEGKMDEPIKMHEHQKFVSVFTGPVTVS